MTMPRERLLRDLTNLEPKLRAAGVSHMALFGSRARNDERSDSDVDVAIDVDPGVRFSLIDLVAVAHEIEDKTALSANVFMRRSLDAEFREQLAKDAVEIF